MLPNTQETADLITFSEEILREKLHILPSGVEVKKHLVTHEIIRNKF